MEALPFFELKLVLFEGTAFLSYCSTHSEWCLPLVGSSSTCLLECVCVCSTVGSRDPRGGVLAGMQCMLS